jgi:hypothetical protein
MGMIRSLKAWAASKFVLRVLRQVPGGEEFVVSKLKGWTTYLVSAAAIFGSLGLVLEGTMSWEQFFQTAEIAGFFATIRHGLAVKFGTHVATFLSGYKTYIIAIPSIIGPLAALAQDKMGLSAAFQMIFTAVMALRVRAGMRQAA